MERPDVVHDFEAWASVSARLHGRDAGERRAIVGELGIAELWQRADAAWANALADDIADMRLDRVERLAAAYASELDRRRVRPSQRGVGGTPFSDDPDDHAPTNKLRLSDLQAHLRRVGIAPQGERNGAPGVDVSATTAAADTAIAWLPEQWARYQAQLRSAQEAEEVIQERHGLGDPLVERQVVDVWTARLRADPALNERIELLIEELMADLGTRILP